MDLTRKSKPVPTVNYNYTTEITYTLTKIIKYKNNNLNRSLIRTPRRSHGFLPYRTKRIHHGQASR